MLTFVFGATPTVVPLHPRFATAALAGVAAEGCVRLQSDQLLCAGPGTATQRRFRLKNGEVPLALTVVGAANAVSVAGVASPLQVPVFFDAGEEREFVVDVDPRSPSWSVDVRFGEPSRLFMTVRLTGEP